LRAHGASRRLRRIGRLVRSNILEEVAHLSKMGCAGGSFNIFDSQFADLAGALSFRGGRFRAMMPAALPEKSQGG
jgi:hypothetical protein